MNKDLQTLIQAVADYSIYQAHHTGLVPYRFWKHLKCHWKLRKLGYGWPSWKHLWRHRRRIKGE